MVRRIVPDFKGQAGDGIAPGNIEVTLYVRDKPQSASITKGPYLLAPGTAKRDVRASGMIFSAKIAGAGDALAVRLGKIILDVVPLGER
jgi:hypothetical protein